MRLLLLLPDNSSCPPPSPTLQVVRRERTLSTFTRSFTLPDNVRDDGVSASLVNGVLKVTVPKAEPAPKPAPKRIHVSGAEAA
jgi:HSP20 family protein